MRYDETYVGTEADKNYFLHLTLKILPGRTDATKQSVGQEIMKSLKELLQDNIETTSLSLEIVDLSTHYFKCT